MQEVSQTSPVRVDAISMVGQASPVFSAPHPANAGNAATVLFDAGAETGTEQDASQASPVL
eukprot:12415191-Karenia_brevis.AAC.1